MENTETANKSERVLLSLKGKEEYNKIKAMLPDYKMTFSGFIDEINKCFIDAVENHNGHFDLQINKPEPAIKNNKEMEGIKE